MRRLNDMFRRAKESPPFVRISFEWQLPYDFIHIYPYLDRPSAEVFLLFIEFNQIKR